MQCSVHPKTCICRSDLPACHKPICASGLREHTAHSTLCVFLPHADKCTCIAQVHHGAIDLCSLNSAALVTLVNKGVSHFYPIWPQQLVSTVKGRTCTILSGNSTSRTQFRKFPFFFVLKWSRPSNPFLRLVYSIEDPSC